MHDPGKDSNDCHQHTQLQIIEFRNFLRTYKLARDKDRSALVKAVKEFLKFKQIHSKYNDSQVLEIYLTYLQSKDSVNVKQIRQAKDAVNIYLNQFMEYSSQDGTGETISDSEAKSNAPEVPDENKVVDKHPTERAFPDYVELNRHFGEVLQIRHYSPITQKTYTNWLKRFFRYHKECCKKSTITPPHVKAYLTSLATVEEVGASTQNQAFSAIVLFFREVLGIDLTDIAQSVRARQKKRLPVVLSVEEVALLLSNISKEYLLPLQLLYGSGIRISELLNLRVQDLDFDNQLLSVRGGKGNKDRTTLLPGTLISSLRKHLKKVKDWHIADCKAGFGEAPLPKALARKYPGLAKEWGWQYVFPADKIAIDPYDNKVRRYHLYDKSLQTAIRKAVRRSGIPKHITAHTLRHSFATHLLQNGSPVREIQSFLGHQSLETTMIYTHIVREQIVKAVSPLDSILVQGDRMK